MISSFKDCLLAAVALVVAVLLAYGLIMAVRHDARGETVPPLQHSIYDARLDELDREAVEKAYKDHVALMFAGWMKDGSAQPFRAQTGARQARDAFIKSMTAIDRR